MSVGQELTEALKDANTYLAELKDLNQLVENAQEQICTTSQETESIIKTTFDNILKIVTSSLTIRRNELIRQVNETKEKTILPLKECQLDISKKIKETNCVIRKGQHLLENKVNCNMDEFYQSSAFLGNLPAVPELKEVPYLTFQYERNLETELLYICRRLGVVFRAAPVQISQMLEKPGGILIEWQRTEADDRPFDIQEFRLQKAFGDVTKDNRFMANFSDCYLGLDTQYLLKDLKINQPYSFRISCKLEGYKEWSPWSLPQVSSTSIPPFCWEQNEDYSFANENRIAVPRKPSPSLLISEGPQFGCGSTVEFTYLEFDGSDTTIALIPNGNGKIKSLAAASETGEFLCFHTSGEICVDGVKKSTKLPRVTKGAKISFNCELLDSGKIRMNIDSCEKRVTYDWRVSKPDELYFVASIHSPKCKIMVE